MRRRLILGLLCVLMAAPAAAHAQGQRKSLSGVFPLLGGYLALPAAERNLFSLAYRAVDHGRPAYDTRVAVVESSGVRVPLAFDRLGFVERLPTLADFRGGAMAEFEGAPFRFQLEARATLAPSTRIAPAALIAALTQLDGDINKVAGRFAIFVPRLTAAFFPGGVSGRVVFAGGRTQPLPMFQAPIDGPTPYFEPNRYPDAQAVVLDQTPSRITLGIPRRFG